MLTLGIDLAASPTRTAICQLEWSGARARVVSLACRASDGDLLALIGRADKVGIDVPLGWPDAFVAAIASYGPGGPWPDSMSEPLRLRSTDRFVREKTGITPLTVSADKIAAPAMRAAALLTAYSRENGTVERTGLGRIVEVYPAAALYMWGFTHTRYKGKERRAERILLLENFRRATSWLDLDDVVPACESDDNAFDALIAALVARAAAVGLTEAVPPELEASAAREGWIALPAAGALDSLAVG